MQRRQRCLQRKPDREENFPAGHIHNKNIKILLPPGQERQESCGHSTEFTMPLYINIF